MDEPIDSQTYEGFTVEVVQDEEPFSPREDPESCFGTMVCWHRNYSLGDVQPKVSPEEYFIAAIGHDSKYPEDEFCKSHLLIPIMAYEHGGITIRAYNYGNWPDQMWDCGQLGFIFVSHKKIKEEFSLKKMSKKALDKARKILESEIETYDDYVTGNVSGYRVKNSDGDVLDSCFGFSGYDGQEEAMREGMVSAKFFAAKEQEEKDAMEQRLSVASAGTA